MPQLFSPSAAYQEVVRGLLRMHQYTVEGQDESEAADALREAMGQPWERLSAVERERVAGLSKDLYTVSDLPPQAPEPMNPQAQGKLGEAHEARQQGEWDRALELLRIWGKYLPAPLLSYLRATIWEAAGDRPVAAVFFEHACRLNPQNENFQAMHLNVLKWTNFDQARVNDEAILQEREKSTPDLVLEGADSPMFFICHQKGSGNLGSLPDALRSAGCRWTDFRVDSGGSDGFNPQRHAGLILMGGGEDSANRKDCYLDEKSWLQRAIERDVPVLGICLGAQLLACAKHGGSLHPGPRKHADVGWKRVIVTEAGKSDPLLRFLWPSGETFQWHQDMLCGPPNGAVTLATSHEAHAEHVEAFVIGNKAYGLQFHPEVTKEMLQDDWLRSPQKPDEKLARIKLDECITDVARIGRKMLDAWIQLAIGRPKPEI